MTALDLRDVEYTYRRNVAQGRRPAVPAVV
ncbi:MAG: hypothetical protein QOH03_3713 [Kribbellaceae bacterium]|jgi:hypothetical protein|nr:hypothetical protein [Kribbellaceae bacterium]